MKKLSETKFFRVLFPNYEPAKQSFSQMPMPLIGKCALILVGAICMLIVGILVSVTSNSIKPTLAGVILSLMFIGIFIWHLYLFTRKKYVRVFAYVARRERSKNMFSKEISTFVVFPDESERELLLGKKKLNIGGEYAFYFGQKHGTFEANCNVLYGYEPAADADKFIKQQQEYSQLLAEQAAIAITSNNGNTNDSDDISADTKPSTSSLSQSGNSKIIQFSDFANK